MNYKTKIKLRKFAETNKAFLKIYQKASKIKIKFKENMSDEEFIKEKYKESMGKELDLVNPTTYNEKLQWLKINDRNPLYTKLVDKYAVREYVSEKVGEEYLIPIIGVWENFDDIDISKLPNQFVFKCNHDCGSIIICKDKKTFDFDEARTKLNRALKHNYFYVGREWPYKNVPPKIVAEKYMEDESDRELKDYKIFCFNGVAKFLFVASDRLDPKTETKFDFFDMEFKRLPIKHGHPNSIKKIERPENLEKMKEIAEKLSKDIPHVRVDLYNINGKIYFGEMTFYHWGGMMPFEPDEWDYKIGDLINLENAYGK